LRELVVRCEGIDFWKKASLLIQTEYTGNVLDVNDEVDNVYIVHACAEIHGCPPALLEYAILLHPEQLLISDENDQLPLHIAVSARSDTIILNDILGASPHASKIRNRQGQLPIEIAVESGRSWADGVGQLLEANPGSLEALNVDERIYPLIWSRLSGGPNAIFESMRARPSVCRTV
jgi:hypothetical protein